MPKLKRISTRHYFFIPAVAVGIGGLIPLIYLLAKAFSAEGTALVQIVFRGRNARLFLNTLLLTGGVLVLDVLLATPAAWLTTRANVKGKRFFYGPVCFTARDSGLCNGVRVISTRWKHRYCRPIFRDEYPTSRRLLGRAPRIERVHESLPVSESPYRPC